MRNGDAYKIRMLAKTGTPVERICHRFRHKYSAAEVMRYTPKVETKAETKVEPKPEVKRAKAKVKAKKKAAKATA